MTRSLKFLMLATDSGLLVYWAMSALVAMRLLNIPSDWLFGHHDDPAVQAWNWSFLPLDVVLSVAGLMSVRLAARNAATWRTLATLSLALTVAAAAVVILLGVTGMTSPELTASEAETRPQAGSDFVYFPSLYVNQATEASEHVQAF